MKVIVSTCHLFRFWGLSSVDDATCVVTSCRKLRCADTICLVSAAGTPLSQSAFRGFASVVSVTMVSRGPGADDSPSDVSSEGPW